MTLASVVHAVVICLSADCHSVCVCVCVCVVCLSHAGTVSKRLARLRITQQLHTIAQRLKFSDAIDLGESTGVLNSKSLALSMF